MDQEPASIHVEENADDGETSKRRRHACLRVGQAVEEDMSIGLLLMEKKIDDDQKKFVLDVLVRYGPTDLTSLKANVQRAPRILAVRTRHRVRTLHADDHADGEEKDKKKKKRRGRRKKRSSEEAPALARASTLGGRLEAGEGKFCVEKKRRIEGRVERRRRMKKKKKKEVRLEKNGRKRRKKIFGTADCPFFCGGRETEDEQAEKAKERRGERKRVE